jgi:WD40 repeat protein
LEIPFVKIVFSLREDYIHYLLELNRLGNLDAINNDILSKNILYFLGNFSPDNAKLVIERLTENSLFKIEKNLTEKLLEDLGKQSGEIRPIELQVVGAQLQEDQITTLAKYQELGDNPQVELVERSLKSVVKDCGEENEKLAWVVLWLLTDENNTRPLKTKAELVKESQLNPEKLELVLNIFVGSGLVFWLPEKPAARYQLVHDYLVGFIRKREEDKKTEQLKISRLIRKKNAITEANKSRELSISGQRWDGLMTAMKARQKQIDSEFPATDEASEITNALRFAVYKRNKDDEFREINRIQGHKNFVIGIAFSPDGETIATASADNTVKLWNRQGKLLQTLTGHENWVNGIAFSPDGETIASASGDNTVKLWNRQGKLLQTLTGHENEVNGIAFSPDGETIASASGDKTVKWWNRQGKLLQTLTGHENEVNGIALDISKNYQALTVTIFERAIASSSR